MALISPPASLPPKPSPQLSTALYSHMLRPLCFLELFFFLRGSVLIRQLAAVLKPLLLRLKRLNHFQLCFLPVCGKVCEGRRVFLLQVNSWFLCLRWGFAASSSFSPRQLPVQSVFLFFCVGLSSAATPLRPLTLWKPTFASTHGSGIFCPSNPRARPPSPTPTVTLLYGLFLRNARFFFLFVCFFSRKKANVGFFLFSFLFFLLLVRCSKISIQIFFVMFVF